MYIEDILTVLAIRIQTNPHDSKFVASFYDQICKGSGLTEKQSVLALKIINKYIAQINIALKMDISPAISTPTYKLGIRVITTTKSISVISHTEFSKAIKVEFPIDEQLLASIKKERPKLGDAQWNPDLKSWIFPLNDASIQFLSSWIESNNFIADSEFLEYTDKSKAF